MGKRCEIASCNNYNPCGIFGIKCIFKKGICSDELIYKHSCKCNEGFYGQYCKENNCKKSKCSNNGKNIILKANVKKLNIIITVHAMKDGRKNFAQLRHV